MTRTWHLTLFLLLATLLFTLAYGQSPLYSSNQNQYFLHGLAQAGVGDLSHDWLANTVDPTPAFSALVSSLYGLVPWPPVFYLLFGLLAGVYLFSLLGIITEVFHLPQNLTSLGKYALILLILHAAVIRHLFVLLLGSEWVHLLDGGVAGQRLLGTVLQPSAFGVFLLLSIYLFLRGKTFGAVFFLALTPTMHPTYLLSAAVLTLVYMGLLRRQGKGWQTSLAVGGGALLGVSPILWHTLITFQGSDPWTIQRARHILVNFRIPHHALPAQWLDPTVAIKVAFIVLALYASRKTVLFHILLWPFLVASGGTLAQVITGSNTLALLFPWRLSTWLVPLSVSALAILGVKRLERLPLPWPRPQTSLAIGVAMALALAGAGIFKSWLEYQEKAAREDRAVMAYVTATRTPGDVYLIPLDMQDFRLVTGAPAYVEFKSIPYKDHEVLEWYRRVSLAGQFYRAPIKRIGCQKLAELRAEGVTHVVMPYDHTASTCPILERQYRDLAYEMFSLTGE